MTTDEPYNKVAAEADRDRLAAVRHVIAGTGYFTDDQIGPDLAPRLVEYLSAIAAADVVGLAAAVDRVRARHPRGDEDSALLAPGLWCPGCGQERADNGYGGCPDRNALTLRCEEST